MKKWLQKIFPAPLLIVGLFLIWLLMTQSYSFGNILLAAILGFVIPIMSAGLRPRSVSVQSPITILRLFFHVCVDAWVSSFGMLKMLLRPIGKKDHSDFFVIPLDMRDPNGLAVLAIITSITPGSAWAELSMDRSQLILHVLNGSIDEEKLIQTIKQRYEKPLMEIFE